ncbi:hypothetical protein [Streptomyces sp. NPDC001770]
MATPPGAQRQFPSGAAYAEALQHTQLCFRHPELRGARPELTKLGIPRAISGAFASVFSLTSATSGQRYAVKCFTRHVPDQELRYRAISDRLARLNPAELSQPWKLGFEYLPDAIIVGREYYPVLKMEWIEAVTLSSWLDDHFTDRYAVDRLAERFASLTRDLSDHEIAHGDFQHGNLLVAADDTFRLVDYDGMYVPELSGLGGTERGHRNYQSPLRGNDDFGALLDRFSAWVVFLSLKAVAADPALWGRLHEPSGEFLLLTEDDFRNPVGSTGLRTLLAHPDPTVSGLAEQVKFLAFQPLELLPPLAGAAVPKQRTGAPAGAGSTASAGSTRTAGTGGLPGWMTGHVAPPAAPSSPAAAPSPAAPAAPPWAAPATAPDTFRVRTPWDLAVAVFWPVALAVAVLMVVGGLPAVPLGPGVPLVLAAAFTAFARGRRTEWTQAKAALRRLEDELLRLGDPAEAAEKLRAEQAALDAAEAGRNAAQPQARARLTAAYHNELKEAEKRRIAALRDLDSRIGRLPEELRKALDRALTDKQSAYVQDHLRRTSIVQTPPYGIGPKLAARLASAGIRTAADFTGARIVRTGPRRYPHSTGAVLVRPGGATVDISGIGQAKAVALEAWRREAVASASARQPTALTAVERHTVEQRMAARRTHLGVQRTTAESEAVARGASARKRLEDGQERLARENTAADDRARTQRREFSRRAVELQRDGDLYRTLSDLIGEAGLRRRGLSYPRYLRFACLGR